MSEFKKLEDVPLKDAEFYGEAEDEPVRRERKEEAKEIELKQPRSLHKKQPEAQQPSLLSKLRMFVWGGKKKEIPPAQALMEAIKLRNVTAVNKLLEKIKPTDIDEVVDENGDTYLLAAIKWGDVQVVQKILAGGASVDAQNKRHGETVLQRAIAGGHKEIISLLLQSGADIHANDCSGGDALYQAVFQNDTATVHRLLKLGAKVRNYDRSDKNALHWAARNGNLGIVVMLLHGGADIQMRNDRGRTALHEAAAKGHAAIVSLFLQDEANIQARDAYFKAQKEYRKTWRALDQPLGEQEREELEQRIHQEWRDCAQRRDAYVPRMQDIHGRTALHQAAEKGHAAVVDLLLKDVLVDAQAQDAHGRTALHEAATMGHEAVVGALLCRKDMNVNMRNQWGETALHNAAQGGCGAVVGILLNHKPQDRELGEAGVDELDNQGRTPLYWAACRQNPECMRLLIAHGADSERVKGWSGFRIIGDLKGELLCDLERAERAVRMEKYWSGGAGEAKFAAVAFHAPPKSQPPAVAWNESTPLLPEDRAEDQSDQEELSAEDDAQKSCCVICC